SALDSPLAAVTARGGCIDPPPEPSHTPVPLSNERERVMHKPSPALVISLLALFVALGGLGVAATGDNFILGQSNSAGQPTSLSSGGAGATLVLSHSGGKSAANFKTDS